MFIKCAAGFLSSLCYTTLLFAAYYAIASWHQLQPFQLQDNLGDIYIILFLIVGIGKIAFTLSESPAETAHRVDTRSTYAPAFRKGV